MSLLRSFSLRSEKAKTGAEKYVLFAWQTLHVSMVNRRLSLTLSPKHSRKGCFCPFFAVQNKGEGEETLVPRPRLARNEPMIYG